MELATVREAVNLVNNTKAISPYTLRQVLESYATIELVKELIANAKIDPSQIDLSSYAKKTDIPTKLSQLDNDDNYVQTIEGIIPAQYLPSYVDDVLEYSSSSLFPNPGDAGKIYVDTTTNLTYRWSGSNYVEISKSLALGTTSNTAYRGDHGLIAYQHTSVTGNPHGLTLGDLSITVDSDTINYLSGLDENILSALYKKLDISGGTLTGYLILHHDPVDKMHAVTKSYVDTIIDGISTTVTQNVTRLTELTDDLERQKKVIEVQADTITEVKNEVTGLNQTTNNHTEAISSLEQNVSGLSSTVSKTSESVTTLEATINLISLTLDQDTIFIQVDKDNKPVTTSQYKIKYTVKFRGNIITPDELTIEGSSEGIEITNDNEFIIVNVDSTKAINKTTIGYTIKVKHTQTVQYEDGKVLAVVLVPKGADGEGSIVSDNVAPTDTNILWLDLNDGKLKRYESIENEDGTITGQWVVINDMSSDIKTNADNLASISEELKKELENLGVLITTVEEKTSTRIDQSNDTIEFNFQQHQARITELMGEIEKHITEQEQYIRFKDGTITLGVINNAYSLYIDNDDVIMLRGDTEISRWHQDIFQSKILSMHDPVLTPGYAFQWIPRNNGSYSLRKVVL